MRPLANTSTVMNTSNKLSLIDIGANLGHNSFNDDLPKIITDARQVGVETIIVTGTSVESSRKALRLSQQYPGYLYSTAGIHPHDAKLFNDETEEQLKQIASHQEVKAMGEMGLDFYRNFSPRGIQEKVLEAQFEIASRARLPVFLHQRDAHDSFLNILKNHRDSILRGVVHCFTGSREELHAYLDLDMYIGITGWVCDERRGRHLHELLKEIPVNRLMLETDAPYLLPRTVTPKPKTRRNEPRNLVYVLETVASCLHIPASELAKNSSKNARNFFEL